MFSSSLMLILLKILFAVQTERKNLLKFQEYMEWLSIAEDLEPINCKYQAIKKYLNNTLVGNH